MANVFKNVTLRDVSTQTRVYGPVGVGDSAVIIGSTIANTSGGRVTVSVILDDSVNETYIIPLGTPIEVGSSLVFSGGDQKLVVQQNESIDISCDTAGGTVDVVLSILEIS